jgi:hypothetical protein
MILFYFIFIRLNIDLMNLIFFSHFQPSTLDLLEVRFHISSRLFSMNLSHDSSREFNKLTRG